MPVQASVGLYAGERQFQWRVCASGHRGMGRGGICHMEERERQREKKRQHGREEEGEKWRDSATLVNSLNAPCWPRGC